VVRTEVEEDEEEEEAMGREKKLAQDTILE